MRLAATPPRGERASLAGGANLDITDLVIGGAIAFWLGALAVGMLWAMYSMFE